MDARWKRLFSLVLCAVLCAALLPTANALAYSDVPQDHWAAAQIEAASRAGIIQGVGGDTFGLGTPMTRAAFATALGRVIGWQTVSEKRSPFTDNADASAWYFSAIETAYENGALTGQSTLARPNDTITREEAAVMIVRALGYTTLAGILQDDALPFTDIRANRGYIAFAYRTGIVTGTSETTFSPDAPTTREQAVALLMRVHERLHFETALVPLTSSVKNVRVVPRIVETDGKLPKSPPAAQESVFAALCDAKETDAVTLDLTPVRWTMEEGKAPTSARTDDSSVASLLLAEGVSSYRSARYGCSYFVYDTEFASHVIWYESEEDVAGVQRLGAMFLRDTLYTVRGFAQQELLKGIR
ncbi:MAG: S-layer homology domain-containing protein [Oscillospiraceae bacterium]|nr:S-layer homology domain-containing protein [Oscillospiraceae bacterium]